MKSKIEKATFGAGCFWGVEAEFRKVKGVIKTSVGYSGGNFKNPSYEDVCNKETGHAEVVQVEYDSSKISYKNLLKIFWSIHNPTSLNRQGNDIGDQYRSVIFYHSKEQKKLVLESKKELEKSGKYKSSIVTQILKAPTFYLAEDYHQQYLENAS